MLFQNMEEIRVLGRGLSKPDFIGRSPEQFHDLCRNILCICSQQSHGDREMEAARSGAAGVQVEHTVALLD